MPWANKIDPNFVYGENKKLSGPNLFIKFRYVQQVFSYSHNVNNEKRLQTFLLGCGCSTCYCYWCKKLEKPLFSLSCLMITCMFDHISIMFLLTPREGHLQSCPLSIIIIKSREYLTFTTILTLWLISRDVVVYLLWFTPKQLLIYVWIICDDIYGDNGEI